MVGETGSKKGYRPDEEEAAWDEFNKQKAAGALFPQNDGFSSDSTKVSFTPSEASPLEISSRDKTLEEKLQALPMPKRFGGRQNGKRRHE